MDEALQYTTTTTSQLRHSPDTQSVLKKQEVGEGTRLSCSLARSARRLGSSRMCSKHALGLGNSARRGVLLNRSPLRVSSTHLEERGHSFPKGGGYLPAGGRGKRAWA